MSGHSALHHALIRTHHITSRKKVAHLKKAADRQACYALLRSGGCPGIMYCQGSEDGVREWVSTVHRLRYKDYQLVARPSPFPKGAGPAPESDRWQPGLHEVATVQEFATIMEQKGILEWWRKAMAFAS